MFFFYWSGVPPFLDLRFVGGRWFGMNFFLVFRGSPVIYFPFDFAATPGSASSACLDGLHVHSLNVEEAFLDWIFGSWVMAALVFLLLYFLYGVPALRASTFFPSSP